MSQDFNSQKLLESKTKNQQRIILISHCALISFSAICLISIATIEKQNPFTIAASCVFVIAITFLSSIVIAKLFLIYQNENTTKDISLNKSYIRVSFFTGLAFTTAGVLLLASQISLWTVLVLLLCTLLLGYLFISLTHNFKTINEAYSYSENLFKKTYNKVKGK